MLGIGLVAGHPSNRYNYCSSTSWQRRHWKQNASFPSCSNPTGAKYSIGLSNYPPKRSLSSLVIFKLLLRRLTPIWTTRWMTKINERHCVLRYCYSHIRRCRNSTPERQRPSAIHSFLDPSFDYAPASAFLAHGRFL